MNLIGEYTQAGALLAAQIQAGQASLRVTRAACGPGHTPASASALEDERQALSLSAHTLSGPTLSVPARLLSVEAASPYMLAEIGLYALDASDTEILYKIYRFDPYISISPACALTATFYLNDTVVAGSAVSVTVSPSGLLTADDADAILEALGDMDTDTTLRLSCTGAQLQSLLDSMPRRMTHSTEITVTGGTTPGNLRIQGFFGMGKLHIIGASQVSVNGYLEIQYCNLSRIVLNNFATHPDKLTPIKAGGFTGASVAVRHCQGTVALKYVVAGEPATRNQVGFYVESSHCTLYKITVKGREAGILSNLGAHIYCRSFHNNKPQNNQHTVRAIQGGFIFLPMTFSVLSSQTGSSLFAARSGMIFIGSDIDFADDDLDDGN